MRNAPLVVSALLIYKRPTAQAQDPATPQIKASPEPCLPDSPQMRFILSLFVISCLLCSCGGAPRYPVVTWTNALNLNSLMEMQILEIHDGLQHSREPHVTHLVSVEILDGPESVIGKRITLPYDKYNTGKEPPSAGSTVLVAPSDWLKRNGSAFGRSR